MKYLTFRNILIIVSIAFLLLTLLVKQYEYFKIDIYVTKNIQIIDQGWFNFLMVWISTVGNIFFGSIILSIFWLYFILVKRFRESLMLLVSSFGALFLSEILKTLVNRPRPDPDLINQASRFTESDSFPSGHVMFAMGLYGFLFFLSYSEFKKGKLRNLAIGGLFSLIFLMGLSRIYLGAHWLSDVLGAYLLGFMWLSAVVLVFKKVSVPE